MTKSKIKSITGLKGIVSRLRKKGKKIVFTNGCFDIIHVGHVRYLESAKKLGDVLIVAVNSNSSVRKFKEKGRPVVGEKERAEIIASLESVDYVVIFSDRYPDKLISILKPDIDVKGGDYSLKDLPEAKTVKSYGGKVKLLKLVKGSSTTNIIKRIKKL